MTVSDVREQASRQSPDKFSVQQVADEIVASMKYISEDNPFVKRTQQGKLTDDNIRRLLEIEDNALVYLAGPITVGAARFASSHVTADYIMEMIPMFRDDQRLAHAAAVAYGTGLEEFPGQLVDPVTLGYVGFITWLFESCDPAAIGLLLYLDTSLWHRFCVLMTPALKEQAGVRQELLDFISKYEKRPDKALDGAIRMTEEALAKGSDLEQAIVTAKLAGHFIAGIWDVAAEDR